MTRLKHGANPLRLTTVTLLAVLMLVFTPFQPEASDHLDAPGLTSPGGDGRLDINDLYAFQSPDNPLNAVLIMTVSPLAGVLSPATFHPGASYNFLIDRDGDAREDIRYRLDFSGSPLSQQVRLRCLPAGKCNYASGAVVAEGNVGQPIPLPWGGQLVAGVFDDPFFFDLDAFLGSGGRSFCDGQERDFFAGLNTLGIILELPGVDLGPASLGVWANTDLSGQVDRVGRPAINTVFIPSPSKNDFNETKPRRDAQSFSGFLGPFADALLPDILTVNTANNQGFLNGRRLADDVIDIELQLITGDASAGDCVGANDVPFASTFPYLAPAH